MTYQRITNFSENELEMGSQELMALGSVWKEKKAELELTGVFQEFIKKVLQQNLWVPSGSGRLPSV